MASRLAVLRDGVSLPDDEARVLWTKMSAWLDAHENDFDGFAKSVGALRVVVEAVGARAVMKISTTTAAAEASRAPEPAPSAAKRPGSPRGTRKGRRA